MGPRLPPRWPCFFTLTVFQPGEGAPASLSTYTIGKKWKKCRDLRTGPIEISEFWHADSFARIMKKSFSQDLDWITPSWTFGQVGGGGVKNQKMLNFAHKCLLLAHKNLFLHSIFHRTINAQEVKGCNVIISKDKNQPNARYWHISKKLKILKNKNLKKFCQKSVTLCYI